MAKEIRIISHSIKAIARSIQTSKRIRLKVLKGVVMMTFLYHDYHFKNSNRDKEKIRKEKVSE